MKTALPIPEQEGFRIWLPSRVRFSQGTLAEPTATGLRLARNATTLSITLSEAARDALIGALAQRGLPTNGLSVTWRQLLEKLAAKGMLVDDAPSIAHGVRSSLDALVAVLDRVHQEISTCFSQASALERLITGRYDQSAAVTWLIENYHYTKSAGYHVAPVLHHDLAMPERRLWERFLKDESWHWRIYRPVFAQVGLSFEDVDGRPVKASTTRLIEILHKIACWGPVEYAAAMIFIEMPPTGTDLDADPLYGGLMRHYGFSRSSMRPLWWHATENLAAGHSALGAVVIANRKKVRGAEVDAALCAVSEVVRAVSAWHEGVLAEC